MRSFNPADWYWQADDGRIFSSAQSKLVAKDDSQLGSFLADEGYPTTWPRDAAGNQTTASLQDVLTPYGLRVDGTAAPRSATGYQIIMALTDTQVSSIKPHDLYRLSGRGQDLIPQDGALLIRIAGKAGMTASALIDAALAAA